MAIVIGNAQPRLILILLYIACLSTHARKAAVSVSRCATVVIP
jgi:hypothetical protein